MDVQIEKAEIHYGFPTVWVENYRATDRVTGQEVEVTEFYQNGMLVTAEGFRVKKDGTLFARKSVVSVVTPKIVKDALDGLRD